MARLHDVERPDPDDVEAYDRQLAEVMVEGVDRQTLQRKIEIADYDPEWPVLYTREEERIRSILGDRVIRIEHVGSSSVPGLPAKPIVDMVLEVPDAADEDAYVQRFGRPTGSSTASSKGRTRTSISTSSEPPVRRRTRWCSSGTGCASTRTIARSTHAAAKRELAARDWKYVQQYADAKTEIVQEILARAQEGRDGAITD
jgi:GrpB-like predicted nucleotidyltransferase (UPF0157 family)